MERSLLVVGLGSVMVLGPVVGLDALLGVEPRLGLRPSAIPLGRTPSPLYRLGPQQPQRRSRQLRHQPRQLWQQPGQLRLRLASRLPSAHQCK